MAQDDRFLPELRALRVFVAVAEAGNLRTAAEHVGRTPSAVSMTLKALEEQLGGPLFFPERKAQLTPLGLLVLDEARELVGHHARSWATMRAFARNQIGRCEVGSVTSVALAFLPQAIARVQAELPEFGVHVRQLESRHAPGAVLDGVVDLAFATRLLANDDLLFEPLFKDELDIVCRDDDPLVRVPGPLPWQAIAGRRFIYNDSFHSLRTSELTAIAERAQLRLGSVPALLAAVREGLGVSVLPRLCRVEGGTGLAFLPVADPAAFRVVGLLSKRERRQLPGTRIFAAAVQAIIRERAAELRYQPLPG